ncbi:MAG TPA: hypothetical protein PL155_03340 [Candidatus Omnitrophota bacterium]|nr:hypothetical protein [Candidatus Omnitrophota bacterium]HPD84488.1 hypothetical protein [Candidatus Omnitrophota bacterium]HRZ03346.1 hypothetical protein [Candidatus Omnitrophota bacterium]
MPYRDYPWLYGPLMIYYYGLFLKLFGISIHSVLIGQIVVNLFSGSFFYLAMSSVISPAMAFLATVWFWTYNTDFFYTYNHAGGITALLATLYCIFLYIRAPKKSYIYFGLFFVLVFSLIKLNSGLFTLAAFFASLLFIDFFNKTSDRRAKRYRYFFLALLGISIIGSIYWFFLRGLPLDHIRVCFPYLSSDRPYHAIPGNLFQIFWRFNTSALFNGWTNLFFGLLIIFSTIQTFLLLSGKRLDKTVSDQLRLILIILLVFCVLGLHEFFITGALFTMFWIVPLKFMLMFIFLWFGIKKLPVFIRISLYALILLTAVQQIMGQHQSIQMVKNPYQYMPQEKAKIYVANSVQWLDTVKKTTEYLESHLKDKELFFAIPHDSIYYYLTGRDSPTWQLEFFKFHNISPRQEREIIRQLEEKKVNYVLLSNRCDTKEAGVGTFGTTHCPLLARYIYENFNITATFGNWPHEGGWAWNHGTKILKRKNIKSAGPSP